MTEHELIQAISIRAELTLEAAGRAYRAMQEIMLQSLERKEPLPKNSSIFLNSFNFEPEMSLA
jgi:nucleoid DNA-binding protein